MVAVSTNTTACSTHTGQGLHCVVCLQAPCIDSTQEPAAVFAAEVEKMKAELLKPKEQITLEPFERDHAVVVGVYRPSKKKTA